MRCKEKRSSSTGWHVVKSTELLRGRDLVQVYLVIGQRNKTMMGRTFSLVPDAQESVALQPEECRMGWHYCKHSAGEAHHNCDASLPAPVCVTSSKEATIKSPLQARKATEPQCGKPPHAGEPAVEPAAWYWGQMPCALYHAVVWWLNHPSAKAGQAETPFPVLWAVSLLSFLSLCIILCPGASLQPASSYTCTSTKLT